MDNSKWDFVIDSKGSTLSSELKSIWGYKDLVYLFVKRDFVVNFKQTVLGPLWYLIQPVFNAIINIIVFGGLAGMGTDGTPKVLFYFSGTMLWSLFSAVLLEESNIFVTNKAIFGKVFFPRLASVISCGISILLRTAVQFALFIFLYIYFLFSSDFMFSGWKALIAFPILLWIMVLGTGIGLIISSITTKYRDLALTLSFFVSLLMYVTPVAYPLSEIPDSYRFLFLFNPIAPPIECFRMACFGVGNVPVYSILVSVGFSLAVFVFGLLLFTKYEKTFIDVI